nr:MAG TPA: hypothetical protein [Bacteriophage sp.]
MVDILVLCCWRDISCLSDILHSILSCFSYYFCCILW